MALSDAGSVIQAIGAVGGGERPYVSMAADIPEHVAEKILEAVESEAAEVYADTFGLQPEATERGGGRRNGEGSYVPRADPQLVSWDAWLQQESGLPGPRANTALASIIRRRE
jgi:hypothetical protein